jgi:hypothetical protein
MVQRIEHPDACDVTFARDGAQRFRSALAVRALHHIDRAVAALPSDQAGVRLHGNTALRSFLDGVGAVGGHCRFRAWPGMSTSKGDTF